MPSVEREALFANPDEKGTRAEAWIMVYKRKPSGIAGQILGFSGR